MRVSIRLAVHPGNALSLCRTPYCEYFVGQSQFLPVPRCFDWNPGNTLPSSSDTFLNIGSDIKKKQKCAILLVVPTSNEEGNKRNYVSRELLVQTRSFKSERAAQTAFILGVAPERTQPASFQGTYLLYLLLIGAYLFMGVIFLSAHIDVTFVLLNVDQL